MQEELNPMQFKAATTSEGPLLVLAGAGSGKTRTLTYRIAYLVDCCGINPANILAITFTNKAAGEMRTRTEELLNGNTSGMWIYTFHAACGRILRRFADRLGFTGEYTIYDDSESLTVVKNVQKLLNIDDKRIPYKKIRAVISGAKDRMETPEEFTSDSGNDYEDRMLKECYRQYQKTLKANDAMDFDDMILMTIKLFRENPDVLEYYQNKFRYILVDEYQDTNRAQYELVTLLSEKYRNICVVGDDDQSIYSFRGAVVENILGFDRKYPDATVIKLEQNYRSTQNILTAANSVIGHNKSRNPKKLWTEKGDGELITEYEADDQRDEAYYIVGEIDRMVREENRKYSDFAVLYRANALSNPIEEACVKEAVPYKVYGGLRFYDRKEIKDLVAYLRVMNNPLDNVALERIVNVPKRGIGETSVQYALEIAEKEGLSLFNVMLNAGAYPKLSRAQGKMVSFAASFIELMTEKDTLPLKEYVEKVLDTSGLADEYRREQTPEAEARVENLKEFLSVAAQFEKDYGESEEYGRIFAEFLQNISLATDAESENDMLSDENGRVTIMTIHSAKGLEFPVVFVAGAEENIFPSPRSLEEAGGLEEERRLCYVAVTRAETKLYITHARWRMLYGKTQMATASRFLREIPDEYIKSNCRGRRSLSGSGFGSSGPAYGSSSVSASGRSGNAAFWENVRKSSVNTDYGRGNFTRGSASGTQSASGGQVRKALEELIQKKTETESTEYITDCAEGERVHHKKFGDGTVTKILGEGPNKTVEIVFDNSGMKRLVLAYAKLTALR